MAGQSGIIVSLQDRIHQSKKASAVERAWAVAKALEDKHQIQGLKWVSPVSGDKGISRRIDFEREFPGEVSVLMPVPMNINVMAPAKLLVPGEDGMNFTWTMPLLTRTKSSENLPARVREQLGLSFQTSKTRPIIEVVSFLPFPRRDAPPEEQFTTEFFVSIEIDNRYLGSSDNYFGAIVRFGDKIVSQFVSPDRTSLVVVADPYHQTLFRAEMLVSLTQAQLASTPENAGTLDIFVYRIAKAFDYRKLIEFDGSGAGSISDIHGGSRGSLSYGGSDLSKSSGSSPLHGGYGGLSAITGGGQRPSLPAPADVPKEVGDTRVGEGTRGEAVKYETLEGYGFDAGFGVQRVSLRCLGVREGARDATIEAITKIASE